MPVRSSIIVNMNQLSLSKRSQILSMLVEGMSIRAVASVADVSRNTVDKLLQEAGAACLDYQDRALVNLPCQRIRCDQAWSFVYAKHKTVRNATNAPEWVGDVWTWVALCADTKLAPCWHVAGRDAGYAMDFMMDVAGRLARRVQLTTDGHSSYLEAVEGAFGADIDYAMLIKKYGPAVGRDDERRYSPADCAGIDIRAATGAPEPEHLSTSYVERQNLTMRTHMRRFTRLANAFSKKLENYQRIISLHYGFYNFCRTHKTLRVTPAMAAGVTDTLHDVNWIVELIDARAPKLNRANTYRKRQISN